ncbi:acetoacetyl-synthase [Mytilinidion resinicola]|uniref:Acetoacetyl-synthase n=1 Tax=Mytilinidion resinicola TaxID=574789 RepID=A0A6A6YDF0_9PEZI|nr:acetoacetyl-synthase [Mytilinidion resinicola]KAF2806024.1 acetoacetyl-synthase [Mytilinidion resinicola]
MPTPQPQKTPLWQPNPATISNTPAAKFIQRTNSQRGLDLTSYSDLHSWSINPSTFQDFWIDAYTFFDIAPKGHSKDPGPALENTHSTLFPPPKFFPQAKLNIAEYLLRNGNDDDTAIHFVREGVEGVERVSWGALRGRVRAMRDAMISRGVRASDVVAAVISNSVDAFVICLAALSIGALWSSASCELGAEAIVERFGQVKPKLVFADDGYIYGGKLVRLGERIGDWSHRLAGGNLSGVVIVPYCDLGIDTGSVYRGETMKDFIDGGVGRELDFDYLPFSHPAFILFSSGTTGAPKCIVHSAGGVLLKVKTDSVLQHDMRDTDIAFQYTTTAWVMWVLNFVNLCSAKSLMLYDGSPFHPTPGVLLKLAEDIGVSVFGTSPRYLAEIRARGIVPRKSHNLEHLRTVTSTGAVLSADMYHWFYETAFPPSAHLVSMSGGTDIAGSFVGGTPLLPVYPGEIQAKALGMAVEVFDASEDSGVPIKSAGLPGELICTRPFPSQPLEFFGAGGVERYRKSYFERFGDKVWCQGDFILVEEDTQGLIMLGRSDGVLNPSGVRFGSAEIYAVTEMFSEIEDSICVGQRRKIDADERVLLFVKMKPGQAFGEELVTRIKQAIRQKYSTRHVPKFVFEVADIPHTVNGKKCEINVKNIVSGRTVAVSGTVANPRSLDEYQEYVKLPVEGEKLVSRTSKL